MDSASQQYRKERLLASTTHSACGIDVIELEVEEVEAAPAPFETAWYFYQLERSERGSRRARGGLKMTAPVSLAAGVLVISSVFVPWGRSTGRSEVSRRG